MRTELDSLKAENDSIMEEMLQMKNKINEQIEKFENTDRQVKKKENEYQIEKEATDHLKDILKKSLSGKLTIKENEEEKAKAILQAQRQSLSSQEEKITLDKFLAIMTAIKNEREVLHRQANH